MKAMENSGNMITNAIYETEDLTDVKAKFKTLDTTQEEDARQDFAMDKYANRRYFHKEAHQKHVIWSEVYKHPTMDDRRLHQMDIESLTNCSRISFKSQEPIEQAEFTTGFTAKPCPGDLGYGVTNNDPSLADSSGNLDLGYEEDDQEDLARALAQRAMTAGGTMRRGSFNGGLTNNLCHDSRRAVRRRRGHSKSSQTCGVEARPEGVTRLLSAEDDTDYESDTRPKRRVLRTKSSDLAETGETRLQRRNSNKSLLQIADVEVESEAESGRNKQRARRRPTKGADSKDSARETNLVRRNSRRSLLDAEDKKEPLDRRGVQRKNSRRSLMDSADSKDSAGETNLVRRNSRRSLLNAADKKGPLDRPGVQRKNSRRSLMDSAEKPLSLSRKNSSHSKKDNRGTDKHFSSCRSPKPHHEDDDATVASCTSTIRRSSKTTSSQESSAEDDEESLASTSNVRRSSNKTNSRSPNSVTEHDEAAARKARRRSNRRQTSKAECDSPILTGSNSPQEGTSAKKTDEYPRHRRRPSLNGALAFQLPSAPALSA